MPARPLHHFALASLLLVLLLTLGLRHLDNADAILPVLCSLRHYQLSSWGQSRFGMLLPLICMPIQRPEWNYLTQALLTTLCWLGACLALPQSCDWSTDSRQNQVWSLLMILSSLCILDETSLHVFTVHCQPYSPGLLLGLLALCASQRKDWKSCFLLYSLAFWVNSALAPTLGLLGLKREHRYRPHYICLGLAFLLQILAARLNPEYLSEEYRLQLPTTEGLEVLSRNILQQLLAVPLLLFALASLTQLKKIRPLTVCTFLALAWVQWFLLLCSAWVAGNGYWARYFAPGYFYLAAGLVYPLTFRFRPQGLAWSWLLPVIAAWRFPPEPPFRVFQTWEIQTRQLRSSGAQLLGGNYFLVYPAVLTALIQGQEAIPLAFRNERYSQDWRPQVEAGQPIAVRFDQFAELDFFLRGLPAQKWQTLERKEDTLLVARTQLQPPPLTEAPVLTSQTLPAPYLGAGWVENEGDWRIYRESADLLIHPLSPGTLSLELKSPGKPRRIRIFLENATSFQVNLEAEHLQSVAIRLDSPGPQRVCIESEGSPKRVPLRAQGATLKNLHWKPNRPERNFSGSRSPNAARPDPDNQAPPS